MRQPFDRGARRAGAIPLAFSGDGLWLPLALALIGGLIVATLGGLLLIPLLSYGARQSA